MRRGLWDLACFAAAVGLLVAGVVGWWRSGPPPSPFPFGEDGGLMLATWSSAAVILAAWFRRSAAPEAFDAPFMGALALAVSAPLSLLSLTGVSAAAAIAAGLFAGLTALPLGWLLADGLVDPRIRRRSRWVAGIAAAGAVLLGWRVATDGTALDAANTLRWALASATALAPAVAVAGATLREESHAGVPATGRLLGSLAVLAMGVAPAVSGICLLAWQWQLLVLPAVAVLATLLVVGRFAIGPLAGLAGRAQSDRDRVVAAADAERASLASALHDGPLADLALLITRLDDRGDADSAAVAHAIAGELRAIGSELRLPVLDDLGTGPALEWLVRRMVDRSGASIVLEQRTAVRPPMAVEFAFYRVAQEALVNALKHGSPPIAVRYLAGVDGAELWVEDAGPGIRPGAVARAERAGRLGLASMAQRAEVTGAQLTIGTGPEGGGRVHLGWRRPASDTDPGRARTMGSAGGMGVADGAGMAGVGP